MKWIVTGGAGFIGCNAVQRLLALGHTVVVVDNLARRGTQANLEWLRTQGLFEFKQLDIRDAAALQSLLKEHADADVILHLAGQVAVTTSVANPREDFEINALGTFNVLEGARLCGGQPIVLYASTNKVYGEMEHVGTTLSNGRYQYINLPGGVAESEPLDFHSPYGCSKGAADQYVRDYARIYGLRTVVLRQSCIYGCRQFGVEDQGWVAWFTIAALLGRPITIYGDGRQVRDVLFAEDLVESYLQAVANIGKVSGQVYNIGGGPTSQLSLLELLTLLENSLGHSIPVKYADWRPGDQKVFIADVSKAKREFGWQPTTDIKCGLEKLVNWVKQNQATLRQVLGIAS